MCFTKVHLPFGHVSSCFQSTSCHVTLCIRCLKNGYVWWRIVNQWQGEFVLLRMTKSNILFLHGRKIMILRSWLDLWLLYYSWQDTCYKLSAKASFTFLGASLFLFWEWTCALWTCNLCKITIVILMLSKWMHVL